MDFYEELGVDRAASVAEIRRAYKRLVRLLHPDHCDDEPMRRLAELQMKRLNGIVAVLSDPEARGNYDSALVLPALPNPPRRKLQWRWAVVAAAACAVLMWVVFYLPAPPAAPIVELDTPVPAAATVARTPDRKTDRERDRRMEKRKPASPEPPRISAERPAIGSPALAATAPSEAAPPDTITDTSTPPSAPPRAVPAPPAGGGLAGEWFFVPPTRSPDGALYPPEYIELRVSEHSGVVRGRYLARYRVTDQAISPAVWFQFEGQAKPDGASLRWQGPAGAEGSVSLRLLTSGLLEVTWVADRMGKELGLISGTATLVRRLE